MFNNPRSGSLAAFILLGLVSIPAGATIYTVMNNTPAVQTEAAKVAAASAGKQETVPNRDWSNGAPDSRKASAPAAESIQEPAQEQAPDLASQQQSADPVLAVSEKETETAAIAAASQETPAPEQTAEPWQTAAVQEYSAVPEYTEPAAQEPVYEEPVNEEPVYEQTVSETWQDPYYYQVYEEPYYYQPYEGPYSEEYYEPCQDVYTESYLPAYDETYYTEDYSCAPYEYSEYGYDESSGYDEAYASSYP